MSVLNFLPLAVLHRFYSFKFSGRGVGINLTGVGKKERALTENRGPHFFHLPPNDCA